MKSQSDIESIFIRFEKGNKSPKIELRYVNSFTLLIAVLLSAQSTDKMVNIVTDYLFEYAKIPIEYINLGYSKLRDKIKKIGLYNTKAKHIVQLSNIMYIDGITEVPNDFNYLISLPGIGRKSANVILNTLYQEPLIGVDTHVFRVSNRVGLVKSKTHFGVEEHLMNIVPKCYKIRAHHWLVLHGRYICKSLKPKCSECIISDLCDYYYVNRVVAN
ncbi:endonuclease III [Anaplasmataceae bacterium AB001_6]|nr:endonuclease III [Anaplasmataceae bacterium AB001_6]